MDNTRSKICSSYLPIYWAAWIVSLMALIGVLGVIKTSTPHISTGQMLVIVALYFFIFLPPVIMAAGYETDRFIEYLKKHHRVIVPRQLILCFVFSKYEINDPVVDWLRRNYQKFLRFVWTACLAFPVILLGVATL